MYLSYGNLSGFQFVAMIMTFVGFGKINEWRTQKSTTFVCITDMVTAIDVPNFRIPNDVCKVPQLWWLLA